MTTPKASETARDNLARARVCLATAHKAEQGENMQVFASLATAEALTGLLELFVRMSGDGGTCLDIRAEVRR